MALPAVELQPMLVQLAQIDACTAATKPRDLTRLVAVSGSGKEDVAYRQLLLVRAGAATGSRAEALAALKERFPVTPALYQYGAVLVLGVADTYRMAGAGDLAEAIATNVRDEAPGALVKAHAIAILAAIAVERGNLARAMDLLAGGIQVLNAEPYQTDEVKGARNRLEAMRRSMQEHADLLIHGLGFTLYAQGNRLRMAGRFKDAIQCYGNLIETAARNRDHPFVAPASPTDPVLQSNPISEVYVQAAELYCCTAQIGNGDLREAKAGLTRISSLARNPYQGEALRLLGDMAFSEEGDLAGAEKLYSQALDTLAVAKLASAAVQAGDLYQAPEASRGRTTPLPEMRTYDAWGNYSWFTPDPEKLYNPGTCSWYNDYQNLLVKTKRSMCRFVRGDSEAAVQDLQVLLDVDPEERKRAEDHVACNYLRLRDGIREGRLFATKAELALFSGRQVAFIISAEVLFETEQWTLAQAAYAKLGDGLRNSLSLPARAYVDFARASAYILNGNPAAAKPFLKDFDGPNAPYRSTPTYWRALFALANQDKAREKDLLALGMRTCPDPGLQVDFTIKLGQLAYVEKNTADARRCFQAVVAKTDPSDYRHRAALTYLQKLPNPVNGVDK